MISKKQVQSELAKLGLTGESFKIKDIKKVLANFAAGAKKVQAESESSLLARVASAKKNGDVTPKSCGAIAFDFDLMPSGEAPLFELFREPQHTDEDIEKSKKLLRLTRDAHYDIKVTKVK